MKTDCGDRLHGSLLGIVGALTAPTSVALSCRWRSRPQHQTRKSALATATSAIPPIATKLRTSREVRFVPKAETLGTSKCFSALPPEGGHRFADRANNTRSAQAEVVPEHGPGRASTEQPSPDLGRCRGVCGVALQTGG